MIKQLEGESRKNSFFGENLVICLLVLAQGMKFVF